MLRWPPIEESFGSRQRELAHPGGVIDMQLSTGFLTFLVVSGAAGAFLLISGLAEKPTEFRILLVAGMLMPACLALLSRASLKWGGHRRHLIGRHR